MGNIGGQKEPEQVGNSGEWVNDSRKIRSVRTEVTPPRSQIGQGNPARREGLQIVRISSPTSLDSVLKKDKIIQSSFGRNVQSILDQLQWIPHEYLPRKKKIQDYPDSAEEAMSQAKTIDNSVAVVIRMLDAISNAPETLTITAEEDRNWGTKSLKFKDENTGNLLRISFTEIPFEDRQLTITQRMILIPFQDPQNDPMGSYIQIRTVAPTDDKPERLQSDIQMFISAHPLFHDFSSTITDPNAIQACKELGTEFSGLHTTLKKYYVSQKPQSIETLHKKQASRLTRLHEIRYNFQDLLPKIDLAADQIYYFLQEIFDNSEDPQTLLPLLEQRQENIVQQDSAEAYFKSMAFIAGTLYAFTDEKTQNDFYLMAERFKETGGIETIRILNKDPLASPDEKIEGVRLRFTPSFDSLETQTHSFIKIAKFTWRFQPDSFIVDKNNFTLITTGDEPTEVKREEQYDTPGLSLQYTDPRLPVMSVENFRVFGNSLHELCENLILRLS